MRKAIAILLAVMFLVTMTVSAVSAGSPSYGYGFQKSTAALAVSSLKINSPLLEAKIPVIAARGTNYQNLASVPVMESSALTAFRPS